MKREIAAGVIVYHQHQNGTIHYLLLHYVHGHWDFPKGRLEGQESIYEAALRELQEETGLYVQPHEDFKHSFDYFLRRKDDELTFKTAHFFVGHSPHQQVTLSHEHINFSWLPLQQALDQLTYENAKVALQMADEFLKTK